MIYTIETLPIVKFVKIAETNDVKLLLKYYPNNKHLVRFVVWLFKLEQKWIEISEEYSKHNKDKKTNKVTELKIKLGKEQGKYFAIIAALEVLKYGSDKDMLDILKSYGYELKGVYNEGLQTIYNQVENLKNKIEGIEKEIEKFTEVKDTKEVSIYDTLVNLFIGLEQPINTNKLTTIEYIYCRKALEKKIKQNNK